MTGKPLLDKILLGLNGVVILLATGLILFAHLGLKKPPIDQALEEANLKSEAQLRNEITPVQMKKIVVNLPSAYARLRFLEIEMSLQPFEEDQKEIIKTYEYRLQNALIMIAGGMLPEELSGVTGKILLESRLKKQVNQEIGQPVIKQIYFSKFVVQ